MVTVAEKLECHYGGSTLAFRAPRRNLTGEFIAFIGGEETRAGTDALPDLIEVGVRIPCINFAVGHVELSAYLREPAVLDACRHARLTVIEITGAETQDNPFYRVHSRRGDRFLAPTMRLRQLYPEVDFVRFSFVHDMLRALHRLDSQRFERISHGLTANWHHVMSRLIREIETPVLLWAHCNGTAACKDPLGPAPVFVARSIAETLGPVIWMDAGAEPQFVLARAIIAHLEDAVP